MKKAVIVGFEGQDGKILKDALLEKRYSIVGVGKKSVFSTQYDMGVDKIDILSFEQVSSLIRDFKPDEVYYLAAFHHSSEDRIVDEVTHFKRSFEVNTLGLFFFLESIRLHNPKTKIFYAASSHVFGDASEATQDEFSQINPISIYGISKSTSLFLCRYYRRQHSIFACVGILYNHESKYRKESFLSKKVTLGVWNIKRGNQTELSLGDLEAVVDWGYAPDYVNAFMKILNSKTPDDYVIATGEGHTVKEFVKYAFEYLGLDWKEYVKVNENLIQKDRRCLIGNAEKLRTKTDWRTTVDFEGLVKKLLEDEDAFDGR